MGYCALKRVVNYSIAALAIATAPLDEPEGYRHRGDHGDYEQDVGGCHSSKSIEAALLARCVTVSQAAR
jgi:hypothetical protein